MMAPASRRHVRVLAVFTLAASVSVSASPAIVGDGAAPVADVSSPSRQSVTGSPWLDRLLADVDRYAARHPRAYVAELVRYYRIPPDRIASLLRRSGISPGGLLYACALARAAVLPCASVVDQWRREPEPGWLGVNTALGVLPGSLASKRLAAQLRATYARWARPLPEDRLHDAANGDGRP